MVKGMLSVIIPDRNDLFINKTIQDLLDKAVENIEIIVNVDENYPDPLIQDKRITYVHPATPKGLRYGVNVGVSLAKGEFIMKTDAHCMFAPGFDKVLKENMQENWLVIPRRYSLDAEKWERNLTRPTRDYHYLCFPAQDKHHDFGFHGVEWHERDKERSDPKYNIDLTPSFQGSCWFANREYYLKRVGMLDDRIETYSTFAQEPQEIGLKYWLTDGKTVVNKKTYYCHLHKGKQYGRMYHEDHHTVTSHNWSARHWVNDEETGMKHPFKWFVDERFPNMPTWPKDWEKELRDTGLLTK